MAALSPSLVWARARWQWVRWRRLPGMAGAVLAVSLLLLVGAGLAWQQARQQWQRQQALADAGASTAPVTRPAGQARRAALQEFYAVLPAQDEIPTLVQSLLDGAEQQGLRAARGNYRLEPEPAAALARLRITLPLRGEPARVQRFVLAAMQAQPTLALDGLQFKRDPEGLALIDAKVQFVLYLQTGPARLATAVADAPAMAVALPAPLPAPKGLAP